MGMLLVILSIVVSVPLGHVLAKTLHHGYFSWDIVNVLCIAFLGLVLLPQIFKGLRGGKKETFFASYSSLILLFLAMTSISTAVYCGAFLWLRGFVESGFLLFFAQALVLIPCTMVSAPLGLLLGSFFEKYLALK